MNTRATTGKNLQMSPHEENTKGAYEIRVVSTSVANDTSRPLLSSLAPRQREPVSCPSHRNYGGRRLRYRDLDNLKPWQVHMLHRADATASQAGCPLNTFVTIFWEATGPRSAAMASTFRRGMKRMEQWLRDKGTRAAFVYVHENPGDCKLNSHLLVHVPRRLQSFFNALSSDWFEALDGGVQVDPRNDARRAAAGLGTRLQYMAKGGDDFTCRLYSGRRASGGQGPISIKRAGVAQWLNRMPARLTTIPAAGQGISGSVTRACHGVSAS